MNLDFLYNNLYVIKISNYFLELYSYFRVEYLFFQRKYMPLANNEYNLHKVELYINLYEKKDVTIDFEFNEHKFLDVILFKHLISKYFPNIDLRNYNLSHRENVRLKFTFDYNDKEYIFYYPLIHKMMIENEITGHIIYPMYNEKILEKARSDIVIPYYNENKGLKNSLYGLFNIDCKHIQEVKINNKIADIKFMEYLEKIKTPFNDFGLSYHCPVKISWILIENGFNTNEIESFEIKFLKGYMDEETYEYKEHIFKTNNLNSYFITDYMFDIIKKKNEDYGRKIVLLN